MARLQDLETTATFTGAVLRNERITAETADEEVREIELEIDKKDFTYEIGQSVSVYVPGPHEFGNPQHMRLYTIAEDGTSPNGKTTVTLCVKRCFYIDEFSGERYPGKASNYLCDRQPGDTITIAGPYPTPFTPPEDETAPILMVGLGTGIAPFRAFVKHIYGTRGGWKGKVRLFYGAKTGLEMLYMNDKKNDFTHYYDEETFKAFEAVSPRPAFEAPAAIDQAIEDNAAEVWDMMCHPETHVYVAGHEQVGELLDQAGANIAGSKDKWERRKAELRAGGRWHELLY